MWILAMFGILIGVIALMFAWIFIRGVYEELEMRFGKRTASLSAAVAGGLLIIGVTALVTGVAITRSRNRAEIERMQQQSSNTPASLSREDSDRLDREIREKTNLRLYYTELVNEHKKRYGKDHWCEAEKELLRLQSGGG
jgi:ABC-type lipoprotein release transport system permease subunit